MKKVIVAILLVLPFLLIYFISFTGQVLSKYTHIAVERITVLDDVGDEYNEDDIIKIGLNEKFNLRIKVYPELASNKAVSVVNTDETICSYDENTQEVTGVEYGISTFLITSVDRSKISFSIKIQVAHDKLEDFNIYAHNKKLEFEDKAGRAVTTKTISLTKGKAITLSAEIVPQTTLPVYRTLIWKSEDRTVAQVTTNGKVTAIAEGSTRIEVKSKKINDDDLEIVKYIEIQVYPESEFYGIGFDYDTTVYGDVYVVRDDMLDAEGFFNLTSITKIGADAVQEGITQQQLYYKVESGGLVSVDVSKLVDGKIKFIEPNKKVSILIYVIGEVEPRDSIIIQYKP